MFRHELYHQTNLNLKGKSIERQAVRALIYRGKEILFVHSPINGDYKLPGGGIEAGEDHRAALLREIREECGYHLSEIGAEIGLITEFSKAMEEDLAFFRMDSHYYKCELGEQKQKKQNLDDYEKDLKIRPVWITPEDALKRNLQVLKEKFPPPKWTKREILFLEHFVSLNRG